MYIQTRIYSYNKTGNYMMSKTEIHKLARLSQLTMTNGVIIYQKKKQKEWLGYEGDLGLVLLG